VSTALLSLLLLYLLLLQWNVLVPGYMPIYVTTCHHQAL